MTEEYDVTDGGNLVASDDEEEADFEGNLTFEADDEEAI